MLLCLTLPQRNFLLEKYLPKLRAVAYTFRRRYRITLDYDDLVSEATLGLIESLDRYNPKVGTDIWTFAQRHIYGRMIRWLSCSSLVHCRGRTLDTEPLTKNHILHPRCMVIPHMEDYLEDGERMGLCIHICESLTTHRDKEVGLLMLKGWSLHEISNTLSISYPKVKRASYRVVVEIKKKVGG